MEKAHPSAIQPEAVVACIDAFIQELQALRELAAQGTVSSKDNLPEQLFGALGQGTWDEYDLGADWTSCAKMNSG
jgi:hypothetical protein